MSQMVAFVAGATGFTGRAVVEALCATGATAIAHVRPDSADLAVWRDRFAAMGAAVDTTAWDRSAMTDTLQQHKVTHIFCLIGTTRERAKAAGESAAASYQAVDLGLTQLLADAAVASKCAPRFIYLSSAGASATAMGAYLQARWSAEAAVHNSGLPFAIARPSIISGDRQQSRPAEKLAAALVDQALGVVGFFGAKTLRDRYRSTDNKTLAQALLRVASAAPSGITYESEQLR